MKKLTILTVLIVGSVITAHAQIAELVFTSQPGDFIGQGQTVNITYTPANSSSFGAQVRRSVASQPAELLFDVGGPTNADPFALLFFGTDQLGIPMQVGNYTNAQRADFAAPGHPGLDISYANRGSNTDTGSFAVHDFAYDSTGITRFLADFTQYSGNSTAALQGTFEYSSTTLFASIPEPSSYAALCAGICMIGTAMLRRRACRSR